MIAKININAQIIIFAILKLIAITNVYQCANMSEMT